MNAMMSLAIGIGTALIWYLVPGLAFLSDLAWFTGFFFSFLVYYILMYKYIEPKTLTNH
jgi:cytosine/uracil/thiamine/allantoin permease